MDTELGHSEHLATGETTVPDAPNFRAGPMGYGQAPSARLGWGLQTMGQSKVRAATRHSVYDFENVFDWRSGPRRGFITAPIPIQPSP